MSYCLGGAISEHGHGYRHERFLHLGDQLCVGHGDRHEHLGVVYGLWSKASDHEHEYDLGHERFLPHGD